MIQEPPPELPEHFPTTWEPFFERLCSWIKRHQPFPADSSISFEGKADGMSIKVRPAIEAADEADVPRLKLIADNTDNPGRVRVTLGGINSDTFWYAAATMDPQEDGSEDHPYYYVTDLVDGESIYIEATVSTDGTFWRIDSSTIGHADPVPTPDDTTAYRLLGTVNVDAGVVTVNPQMNIGNQTWERAGIAGTFLDRWANA